MEALQNRIDSFTKSKRIKKPAKSSAFVVVKWPHPTNFKATPEALAEAGFFFNPSVEDRDGVSCFMCAKHLSDWEKEDDPFDIHWDKCGATCGWASVRCGLRHDMDRTGRFIFSDKARLPTSKIMERARLETFSAGEGWIHDKKRNHGASSKKMASAGFVYSPQSPGDDLATCLYCNVSLSGWDDDDDPLEEHRKRQKKAKSACPFFSVTTVGTPATITTTTTAAASSSVAATPIPTKPPSRTSSSSKSKPPSHTASASKHKDTVQLTKTHDGDPDAESQSHSDSATTATGRVTRKSRSTSSSAGAGTVRVSSRTGTRSKSRVELGDVAEEEEGSAVEEVKKPARKGRSVSKSVAKAKAQETDIEAEEEETEVEVKKKPVKKGRSVSKSTTKKKRKEVALSEDEVDEAETMAVVEEPPISEQEAEVEEEHELVPLEIPKRSVSSKGKAKAFVEENTELTPLVIPKRTTQSKTVGSVQKEETVVDTVKPFPKAKSKAEPILYEDQEEEEETGMDGGAERDVESPPAALPTQGAHDISKIDFIEIDDKTEDQSQPSHPKTSPPASSQSQKTAEVIETKDEVSDRPPVAATSSKMAVAVEDQEIKVDLAKQLRPAPALKKAPSISRKLSSQTKMKKDKNKAGRSASDVKRKPKGDEASVLKVVEILTDDEDEQEVKKDLRAGKSKEDVPPQVQEVETQRHEPDLEPEPEAAPVSSAISSREGKKSTTAKKKVFVEIVQRKSETLKMVVDPQPEAREENHGEDVQMGEVGKNDEQDVLMLHDEHPTTPPRHTTSPQRDSPAPTTPTAPAPTSPQSQVPSQSQSQPQPQPIPPLSKLPFTPLQALTDAELDMTVEEWIRYQMGVEYDKFKRDGERELERFTKRAEEVRMIIEGL